MRILSQLCLYWAGGPRPYGGCFFTRIVRTRHDVSLRCSSRIAPLSPLPPFGPLPPIWFVAKINGDLAAAIYFIGILCQLLNKYFFSLDYTVVVNCNYNVYTLNRSWDSCTGRCEVSYRNNLCALNNEVLDVCTLSVVNVAECP